MDMYCVGYLDEIFEFDDYNTAFEFGMSRRHKDKGICLFIGKSVIDNGCHIVTKKIGTDYFYFND